MPDESTPLERHTGAARRQLSIEWKLPLLISLLLAIVIGVSCVAAYQEMRSSALVAASNRLRSAADQLADLSGTSGAQRGSQLRSLGRNPAIRAALTSDAARGAAQQALTGAVRLGDSAVVAMDLWTRAGVLRLSSGAPMQRADSAMVLPVLEKAVRIDSVARTPLYAGNGNVYLVTIVPIDTGDALRPAGAITERRRLLSSAESERQIRKLVGQDLSLLVTNRSGDLWTDLRGRIQSPPLPRLPASRSFTLGTSRSERTLGAWAPVQGSPWVFVLTVPESTVLGPSRDFLFRMLIVGAVLMLIGAAGAWLVSRGVTRPLREVADAAAGMAAGDLARRVATNRGDEIGRLAQTFNVMAARIEATHTELAQRAAAAQAANEAKTQFLALMSHELRTPLNAIGGYAELLEIGVRGPVNAAQLEDLRRIRRSKDHLLSIINDLLDHARIEAGQLSLGLTSVRLSDALAEVEALTAPALAGRRLRYERECGDDDLTVKADYKTLCQVLMNLVSNAIRFTEPDGTIRVACEATAHRVAIHVHDTGIGIPPEKLDTIFEPFVQVDAGLTRRTDGTGLGLAISRTLADAMEGSITVESEIGLGSTFTLTLQRAPALAKTTPARAVANAGR